MARHLTLYTRPGCTLCQEVLEDLQLLAGELDLEIATVDIGRDPALLERYQCLIPVVDVDDGPVLVAPVSIRRLRQVLAIPAP